MTTLYFVRHTESLSNSEGKISGITDRGVSENGYVQLERLAQRFRDIPLDRVFASPLIRTRATADAVNRYHGLDIAVEPRLIEINIGDWEESDWWRIKKAGGELFERWQLYPDLFEAENGDKMSEFYTRAAKAVCDIAAGNDGRAAAIVTHGCFLRNVFSFMKHRDILALRTQKRFYNTSVSKVLYEPSDGSFTVEYENDVSHLDGVTIL